jgi:Zn-dependent protease with chaperone function
MPDFSSLLFPLASVYGAALATLPLALAVRGWLRRGGRLPSPAEAGLCAGLPALAALLVPVCEALQPHASGFLAGVHHAWHAWEDLLHATPAAHGTLHAANLLLIGLALYRLLVTATAVARARRALRAVRAGARERVPLASDIPVYRLSGPRPACFTAGVARPSVYVSDGLLAALAPREAMAMLAHERAHVCRRDGLVGGLLGLFYGLVPLPGGRELCREWQRAAERACDAEAARQLGSRCDVAAALVRVAGIVSAAPATASGVCSFTGSEEEVEERVRALLAPSGGGEERLWGLSLPAGLLLVFLAALLALSSPIGHAVAFFVHH